LSSAKLSMTASGACSRAQSIQSISKNRISDLAQVFAPEYPGSYRILTDAGGAGLSADIFWVSVQILIRSVKDYYSLLLIILEWAKCKVVITYLDLKYLIQPPNQKSFYFYTLAESQLQKNKLLTNF